MQQEGLACAGPFWLARIAGRGFLLNTTDGGSAIGGALVLPASDASLVRHTLPVVTADGSRFELLCIAPAGTWRHALYWLPALGISARHYLPLAEALAARGIAVVIHEWRGIGSSSRRASRQCSWGYREILEDDLPVAHRVLRARWPRVTWCLGGHSLGGQIALLRAALTPAEYAGIVLVASGAPYWRQFRRGWLLAGAFVLAPCLAWLCGYLPGRRLRFGGREARGVIADWARTGRSGRYIVPGLAVDLERALAKLRTPVLGLRLADDWLGPARSLQYLLDKVPLARRSVETLDAQALGVQSATHFAWMQTPQAVAARSARWIQTLPASPPG